MREGTNSRQRDISGEYFMLLRGDGVIGVEAVGGSNWFRSNGRFKDEEDVTRLEVDSRGVTRGDEGCGTGDDVAG